MLIPVKFNRSWRAYNAGEIAGFEPELASDIVSCGAAELVLSEELEQLKKSKKQVEHDSLDERRKAKINASNIAYNLQIAKVQDRLEKKKAAGMDTKEEERLTKKMESEKGNIATLIAESKNP